jgi:hypothetical protein
MIFPSQNLYRKLMMQNNAEKNARDERKQSFSRHGFIENKRCNRVRGNIERMFRYTKNTEER